MNSYRFEARNNFLTANYKEILVTGALLVGFYFLVRGGLQQFAPDAATMDFGTVDVLAFAALTQLFAYLVTWVVLRVCLKTLNRYVDQKGLRREFFEEIPALARVLITLGFVAFNVYAFISIVGVLISR